MIKASIAASLLFTASTGLAQQAAQPAGPAETTVPTPPSGPTDSTTITAPTTTTDPAAPAGQTAPTTSTTEPTTSGTQAPSEAAADPVTATVEADWAKYDANGNGSLSRAELGKWLTDLQSAAGEKAPGKSYLAAAFQKADADKSRSVSKEELATFLRG